MKKSNRSLWAVVRTTDNALYFDENKGKICYIFHNRKRARQCAQFMRPENQTKVVKFNSFRISNDGQEFIVGEYK